MFLNIWSEIGDFFIELANDIKDFFIEHSRNPFLWIGILVLGIVIFEFVYKALHRD